MCAPLCRLQCAIGTFEHAFNFIRFLNTWIRFRCENFCNLGSRWYSAGVRFELFNGQVLTCARTDLPHMCSFFWQWRRRNNYHKIPQLIMFCCATSWCTVAFQKPRSRWHKLPSTNGLPRNMFLPFCRLPLSSSLRLSLDWYNRSPRGRVYSTLKQQGRLPWIFASAWFVFRVSGIFYLIWHDVIPLTLLLAKALIISAASFMLILPLDKIEDSAKPRLCQRLVLSASMCIKMWERDRYGQIAWVMK